MVTPAIFFDIRHKIVLDRYMFGHEIDSRVELGNDSADLRIAQMLQHLTDEGDIGNGEIMIHHVEATEIDVFSREFGQVARDQFGHDIARNESADAGSQLLSDVEIAAPKID